MKIASIETIIVDIPLIRPHKLSFVAIDKMSSVIVRIRTDTGATGLYGDSLGRRGFAGTRPLRMKNRIEELRRQRAWSQANLAGHLGVPRQTINALERGRYDPSLPLAFAIARMFCTSIEEIFPARARLKPCTVFLRIWAGGMQDFEQPATPV